jgi:hypothetical protein
MAQSFTADFLMESTTCLHANGHCLLPVCKVTKATDEPALVRLTHSKVLGRQLCVASEPSTLSVLQMTYHISSNFHATQAVYLMVKVQQLINRRLHMCRWWFNLESVAGACLNLKRFITSPGLVCCLGLRLGCKHALRHALCQACWCKASSAQKPCRYTLMQCHVLLVLLAVLPLSSAHAG